MEKLSGNVGQALDLLLKSATWLIKTVESQADFLATSLLPHRHRRSSSDASAGAPGMLLKKVGYGLIGAAYACMALTVALAVAVAIGVGTIRMWVEEPVVVRESLHFDYTDFRPEAVFSFGGGDKGFPGVPVGHTYYVSLVMVLPESDYNQHVGVFQLTGEVLSTNGTLMARSSQPCMLQFHSRSIRLARIFLMGIPLLLGTSLEAQKLNINLIRYHEAGKSSPRTGSIRITMSPRAGAGGGGLPQLYESQILIRSQLPWPKELVRSWKWTFYVWTSLYVYITLLALMLCCFRPLVFLGGSRATGVAEMGGEREDGERRVEEMDADTLRKWQQHRRKRKAEVLGWLLPAESMTAGSSATSYTVPKEEEGGGNGGGWGGEEDDDVTDSSSVCS